MSRAACLMDGCERESHALGMCGAHYAQHKKSSGKECFEPDCERKIFARFVCQMHYKRLKDAGLIRPGSCVAYRCGELAVESQKCAAHIIRRACAVPDCSGVRNDADYCIRHYHRKAKYGLTHDQLVALDGDVECLICGEPATCVDHCHATGAVRGVLCKPCNTGLGHFRDNTESLARAIQYLQRGDTARVRDIQTQLGLAA